MELVRKSISKWIVSAVVLVIGILCIVAGAASGETSVDAYTGISMTLGITLLVIAGLSLLVALIATILSRGKVAFITTGAASAATLATGIFFVVDKNLGSTLIWIFLNYVPYFLLSVGGIIAVDGILVLVFGFANKDSKNAIITAVFEFIMAAIVIVLGALMVGNDPVISKSAQIIIFGIVLIIYSLLFCASTLLLNNNGFNNKNEAKPDAIDAEVKDAE
ncbi:MAG: hypothetical protein IKP77_05785 [Acholeplasmatales bacterium]|nr:hypothetical protein [Acholeplasmatales bacterium]